jgi:hypothetical protein
LHRPVVEGVDLSKYDSDGDLVVDSKDKCVETKEDWDKFEDEDGCEPTTTRTASPTRLTSAGSSPKTRQVRGQGRPPEDDNAMTASLTPRTAV